MEEYTHTYPYILACMLWGMPNVNCWTGYTAHTSRTHVACIHALIVTDTPAVMAAPGTANNNVKNGNYYSD